MNYYKIYAMAIFLIFILFVWLFTIVCFENEDYGQSLVCGGGAIAMSIQWIDAL